MAASPSPSIPRQEWYREHAKPMSRCYPSRRETPRAARYRVREEKRETEHLKKGKLEKEGARRHSIILLLSIL